MNHPPNLSTTKLFQALALGAALVLAGCATVPERKTEAESYLVLQVEDAGLSSSYSDASPMMTSSTGAGRQKLKKGLNFIKFPDHQDYIEIRELLVASPQHPSNTSWATVQVGAVVGRPAPGTLVVFPQKFRFRTEIVSRSGRDITTRVAAQVPELAPKEVEAYLIDLRNRATATKDGLRWEHIVVWDRAPAF